VQSNLFLSPSQPPDRRLTTMYPILRIAALLVVAAAVGMVSAAADWPLAELKVVPNPTPMPAKIGYETTWDNAPAPAPAASKDKDTIVAATDDSGASSALPVVGASMVALLAAAAALP